MLIPRGITESTVESQNIREPLVESVDTLDNSSKKICSSREKLTTWSGLTPSCAEI